MLVSGFPARAVVLCRGNYGKLKAGSLEGGKGETNIQIIQYRA